MASNKRKRLIRVSQVNDSIPCIEGSGWIVIKANKENTGMVLIGNSKVGFYDEGIRGIALKPDEELITYAPDIFIVAEETGDSVLISPF